MKRGAWAPGSLKARCRNTVTLMYGRESDQAGHRSAAQVAGLGDRVGDEVFDEGLHQRPPHRRRRLGPALAHEAPGPQHLLSRPGCCRRRDRAGLHEPERAGSVEHPLHVLGARPSAARPGDPGDTGAAASRSAGSGGVGDPEAPAAAPPPDRPGPAPRRSGADRAGRAGGAPAAAPETPGEASVAADARGTSAA